MPVRPVGWRSVLNRLGAEPQRTTVKEGVQLVAVGDPDLRFLHDPVVAAEFVIRDFNTGLPGFFSGIMLISPASGFWITQLENNLPTITTVRVVDALDVAIVGGLTAPAVFRTGEVRAGDPIPLAGLETPRQRVRVQRVNNFFGVPAGAPILGTVGVSKNAIQSMPRFIAPRRFLIVQQPIAGTDADYTIGWAEPPVGTGALGERLNPPDQPPFP